MPYLSGLLTGIVLTVLVLFLIDQYGSGPDRQMVVNWGVLTQKLAMVTDQVREEVHHATAPDYEKSATAHEPH
jgi:hypothetical protein